MNTFVIGVITGTVIGIFIGIIFKIFCSIAKIGKEDGALAIGAWFTAFVAIVGGVSMYGICDDAVVKNGEYTVYSTEIIKVKPESVISVVPNDTIYYIAEDGNLEKYDISARKIYFNEGIDVISGEEWYYHKGSITSSPQNVIIFPESLLNKVKIAEKSEI